MINIPIGIFLQSEMRKSDRTKQLIIEQVAPIFNKKGVHGTSLSDITKATGLTKGAIYGNFENKDQLAMLCYEYNLRFLQKGLYKSLAINGSAIQKLQTLVDFYREHYQQVAENGGCPLMNSAIEADDAYPILKDRVKSTLSLWHKELVSAIVESQRTMEVNTHLDPNAFASTFIAMIEGGILVAKTMNSSEYFSQISNRLKLLIENELRFR